MQGSMPARPILFLAAHAAAGFAIALLAVLALLWADPAGIGTLLRHEGNLWPAALLWFFLGLTCASIQMGSAIMGLGRSGTAGRR
jgi:hypothetical protein